MVYDITEDQLFDYLYCPIYYQLKYKHARFLVDRPPTMNRLLNQIVRGFCIKLRDGIVEPLPVLRRRWDMLCKKYPSYLNNQRIREGIADLNKVYNWAYANELRIANVGSNYTLLARDGQDEITYHGTLGIIIANHNNIPENLVFDFSKTVQDQALLDLKLKTTFEHIGFYALYNNKLTLAGTRIHNVKHGKDSYTTRDIMSELPRIKKIIINVFRAIQNEIWYPHETPLCKSCNVRDFCMMYGKRDITKG